MAEVPRPSTKLSRATARLDAESGAFLGPLLHALAESLDVGEIFDRISAEARAIVPHDFLMLGLLSEDHSRVRVIALSGDLPPTPGDVAIPAPLRLAIEEEAFVLNHVAMDGQTIRGMLHVAGTDAPRRVEYGSQPLFTHLYATKGLRSFMRVSVRLRGGVLGGLIFCSVAPDAFTPHDVEHARQIAACVALAVAHQRLAEEEQKSAEARERASMLEVRVRRLTEELETQGRHRVLGTSAKWKDVLNQAAKVAPTEATVLLSGESGTGKEVIARLIHRASPRADGPFVALNCAALPEQLLESELFGHEKGAFTGALAAHPGRIEQAAGGVLFLDEVGEMSPTVQAKLLRVLQEREYQKLGSVRTIKADVRVLAATNRDLRAEIARGAFREDLYYRLGVFDITLPPLRERREDIPALAEAFVAEVSRSMGRRAPRLASDALEKLCAYAWPGNVRELHNVIERAVILCEGAAVGVEQLPAAIAVPQREHVSAVAPSTRSTSNAATLETAEREMIVEALARAGNNKSKAARILGLTRAQLRSRIEKHRLGVGG